MMDFIFGGDTGIATPEELARRRELVRAIRARNAGTVARDPWEGLNAVADAIGGRIEESRINKAEAAGRSGADEKFRRYLQVGQGSPPPVDLISDPWMSDDQRDVLKTHFQRQLETPDPARNSLPEKQYRAPGPTTDEIDQELRKRGVRNG